jgi:hypothetical protein
MTIDHFYFCVSKPEEAAKALLDLGFVEGAPNIHPGQGTANRRFFFQNMMMELLYVINEDELHSERTRVLGLDKQFHNAGRSSIGILLRPSEDEEGLCPFKSAMYQPEYLPESLYMNIAVGLNEGEPNFIYLSFAGKPDNRENASHILDGTHVSVVSNVKLKTKSKDYSDSLLSIINASDLEMEAGGEELLEIELDGSINGKEKDFQPILPLRIKW